MRDFYANLSTGKWPVVVTDVDGATCHTKAIVILPKAPSTRDYMDTCVHETLHACNPIIPEVEVCRMAKDIAEVLWKVGYRLPKAKP
jgi:hypothetical protein